MYNRYSNPGSGVRLEEDEDGRTGQCIDVGAIRKGDAYDMFVRDCNDQKMTLRLTIEDIYNLREGLSNILIYEGHERRISVAVPT